MLIEQQVIWVKPLGDMLPATAEPLVVLPNMADNSTLVLLLLVVTQATLQMPTGRSIMSESSKRANLPLLPPPPPVLQLPAERPPLQPPQPPRHPVG